MTGATLSCILCQVPPENSDVDRIMKNCDLLDGAACTACKDCIALEAKISATRQSLIELIKQRPKMRERVNKNHDTLANSIPLELVGSIFQFRVSTPWKFEEFEQPSLRKAGISYRRGALVSPISLGSICKNWRNIAWSMKPLWTAFTLHINEANIYPDELSLIKEWLERAGQLPLSLRISGRRGGGFSALSEPQAEKAKQLIALINERSNQWEHLDVSGQSWLISQFNGGLRGAANLQTLKIASPISGGNEFTLIDAMPRPSRLILNSVSLSRVHVEWTHLTHVCVDRFHLDESIELLRRATNLIYCKIELIDSELQQKFPMPDEPILRLTLESFSISAYPTRTPAIMTFFKSLIFPNLKHLNIQCFELREHFPGLPSWAPMVPLILNSSSPLISLGIHYLGPHSISEFVIPILQRTPSLRDLEIVAPFVEEWDGEESELFQLLANTYTSSSNDVHNSFLPNLRTIKFHLSHKQCPDKFWNSIPRIFGPISDNDIHSRRHPSRPLKTLRVQTNDLIESADVVSQLLRLRQGGIVLDLKDIHETTDVLEKSIEFHGLSE